MRATKSPSYYHRFRLTSARESRITYPFNGLFDQIPKALNRTPAAPRIPFPRASLQIQTSKSRTSALGSARVWRSCPQSCLVNKSEIVHHDPSIQNLTDLPQVCERTEEDEGDIYRPTPAPLIPNFCVPTVKYTPFWYAAWQSQGLPRILTSKTPRNLGTSPRISVNPSAGCFPIHNPCATTPGARL